MSSPVPRPRSGAPEESPGSYAGWYIGAGVVVAVLAVGAALWFMYHP
jgi:hypothetical protein